MTRMELEINGVSKRFPGKGSREEVSALRDMTLSVAKGEFVALHGPSGCGKSTLLMMAGGLLRPDIGVVRMKGQDLYAVDNSQRARLRAGNLGFVFQQFHLIPYLDVLGNVMVTELATGHNGDAVSRAKALLEQFGVADRAGHHPSELSVGEQQRVALARACAPRPAILLADEPTGNLDSVNGEAIINLLFDLRDRYGATLVLVTHDPALAKRCDRAVSLADGRIV